LCPACVREIPQDGRGRPDADLTADMDEEEKAAWTEFEAQLDDYTRQYKAALGKFLDSKGYKRKTAAKPQPQR